MKDERADTLFLVTARALAADTAQPVEIGRAVYGVRVTRADDGSFTIHAKPLRGGSSNRRRSPLRHRAAPQRKRNARGQAEATGPESFYWLELSALNLSHVAELMRTTKRAP